MTANKMPEMPEAVAKEFAAAREYATGDGCFDDRGDNDPLPLLMVTQTQESYLAMLARLEANIAAHGRACYLAGIAAAKEYFEAIKATTPVYGLDPKSKVGAARVGWNVHSLADQALANLTALEQEAKK